jgi:hypothetical protein
MKRKREDESVLERHTRVFNFLEHLGAQGLANIELRNDATRGFSCFAKRDYLVGDVIATVPISTMLGLSPDVANSTWCKALLSTKDCTQDSLVTKELIIWIGLALSRKGGGEYLESLDDIAPTPENWPHCEVLKSMIGSTNLASTCLASETRLRKQSELIAKIAQADSDSAEIDALRQVSYEDLMWAKGHYLSRRYPSKLAGVRTVNNTTLGFQDVKTLAREPDLGSDKDVGCMVPLLDLFNHDHTQPWLDLRLDHSGLNLQILCSYPVEKGRELLSNYGPLSNEVLMRAYGFALENNPNDTVGIRLCAKNPKTDAIVRSAPMQLVRGGLAKIPHEMWEEIRRVMRTSDHDENANDVEAVAVWDSLPIRIDDADVLLSWAEGWLLRHKTSQLPNPKDHLRGDVQKRMKFCKYYLTGQIEIVEELLRDLTEFFNELDDGFDEGDEEDDEE